MISSLIISKLVLATVAIFIAEFIRRSGASARITYLSWVGVFLVLITPSALTIPIGAAQEDFNTASAQAVTLAQAPPAEPETNSGSPCSGPACDSATAASKATPAFVPTSKKSSAAKSKFPFIIAALWLVGTLFYLARAWRSNHRLNLLTQNANPAPLALRNRVIEIAEKLDINTAPCPVVADFKLSPFLCTASKKKNYIVFPKELLEKSSQTTQDAIIIHELLHLRRKDCLRHLFDQFIVAIWWWFPGSWYAQNRLREAEEHCVDREVIAQNLITRKEYASAFLEAIDLISSRIERPLIKPSFASPNQLTGRIEAILGKTQARSAGANLKNWIQGTSAIVILLFGLISFTKVTAKESAADRNPEFIANLAPVPSYNEESTAGDQLNGPQSLPTACCIRANYPSAANNAQTVLTENISMFVQPKKTVLKP